MAYWRFLLDFKGEFVKRLFIFSLLFFCFVNLSAENGILDEVYIEEDSVLVELPIVCVCDQFGDCDGFKVIDISMAEEADEDDEEMDIIFLLDDKVLNDIQLALASEEYNETYKNRKKKKKEKVAAIFWGLANAATSLAQAVGGKPKEGITNFVGAVFGTAAQIAQIEANYKNNPELVPLKSHLIFNLMLNMTESLYEIISSDNSINTSLSRFPTLKELSLIAAYAERAAWVANKILDNSFVQSILKESLDYLEVYLHEQVDEVMDYLKEKLLVGYKDEIVTLST